MLRMYKLEEYKAAERGSCNICLGVERGEVLCFYFETDFGERKELAHRECLEHLLDPENFNLFIAETRQKMAAANKKLADKKI